jgi:VIT1/CCC1 family predicted Fe2+/Mn2+ transporter
MPSSSPPPPDRFQQEIDDIIRLAEKRLERQSVGGAARRSTRGLQNAVRGLSVRMPRAESLAGWGLALMLLSWLMGLLGGFGLPLFPVFLSRLLLTVGVALLAAGLILSLTRGKTGWGGGGEKMWRGERISYGSPYGGGEGFFQRLLRFFRGRR